MTNQNLWDEIDAEGWEQIPHIKNRVALEQVIDGLAVFHIDDCPGEHKPYDIQIPSLAYQKDDKTNENILVVIIQAEKVNGDEVIGLRYFSGGNGVCMLSELIQY